MNFIRKIVQEVLQNEHMLNESVSLKTIPFLYAIRQRYPGEWKIYFEAKNPFNSIEVGQLTGLKIGKLKSATKLFQNDFEFINHRHPWTVQKAIRKVWESLEKIEVPIPGKVFAFKVADTGEWFIASVIKKSVVGELMADGSIRYSTKDERGNDIWKVPTGVNFKNDPINAARYIFLNTQERKEEKLEEELVSLNESSNKRAPYGFIGHYKASTYIDGEMYQFYIGDRESTSLGLQEIKIGKLLKNGRLFGIGRLGGGLLHYELLGEGIKFDASGVEQATTILWNNLKEKEFLKGTGLFAFKFGGDWIIYTSDDIHKYGAPRKLAILGANGMIRYSGSSKGEGQIFDGPMQAMRFIYINTQKPNTKDGIIDEDESLNSAKKRPTAKTFIPMPDVAGYNALFDEFDMNAMEPAWQVYNEKNKKVIIIFRDGSILYRRIGDYFNSGWEDPGEKINFGFNEDGVKQAARWYYINHGQKPNPITEANINDDGGLFRFPDIDDYEVSGPYSDSNNQYDYYSVTEKSGKEIGKLNYASKLLPKFSFIVFLNPNKKTPSGRDKWEEIEGIEFDNNNKGIEQATRYIYLMRQKQNPITEATQRATFAFRDIDGYKVFGPYVDLGYKYWDITDKTGTKIAELNDAGKGKIGLEYLVIDEEGDDFWIAADTKFDETPDGIKQAARYAYVMRQTPNYDALSEESVESKKEYTVKYPNIGDYSATKELKDNMVGWKIFDSNKEEVGYFTVDGTLMYKMPDIGSYRTVEVKIPNLKNAVRYIYLNSQPTIDKFKSGDKFYFPDIDDWYAVLSKDGYFIISDQDGRSMAFLTHDGQVWFYRKDTQNQYSGHSFPFTKEGLENAVRFVYLQKQIPNEEPDSAKNQAELTEIMHGPETEIPGLDGWSVVESKTDAGIPWWDIMDKDGVWIGYFMKVGDKYKLTYTSPSGEQINVDQDFGDNYINAARYVYLMRQKAK